jgi:ABC-2 type transport system permease protein
MSTDVWTMAWKEWKELFARQGRFRGGTVNFLLVLGVFGILMPWQFGRAWVDSPMMLLSWTWVPLFMLSNVVVDAIAGERERHTLETLLASRLPNQAILLGKIAAAIGYGLSVIVGGLAVGLVTTNVLFAEGRFLFYPPATLIGVLVLGVLGATLTAGLGVHVSLRAGSVRQAGQVMGLAILLVSFGPLLAARSGLNYWRAHGHPTPISMETAGLVFFACLVVLDAGLIATALLRFRRSRLILD